MIAVENGWCKFGISMGAYYVVCWRNWSLVIQSTWWHQADMKPPGFKINLTCGLNSYRNATHDGHMER